MQDIRGEIDRIDRAIISLIGQRYDYVKAATKFKCSAESVNAQDRVASMLQTRRLWAEEHGLSADVIEKIYRDLVEYFIQEEMERWQAQQT